jgi:hypothetical protein
MLQCSTFCSAHTPKEEDMSATETGPGGPVTAAAGEKIDVMESITGLYTKGIERLAEAQKKGIDLAAEQNAEWVNMWKKLMNGSSPVPGLALLDMATAALQRNVDTQKGAIDLMVEQSHALASMAKDNAGKATKVVEENVAKAKEVIKEAVAGQKAAIDNSAKQTKAAFENAKQQFGYAGTPVGAAADSMQHGLEVVEEAQKDMLDTLAEPVQVVH